MPCGGCETLSRKAESTRGSSVVHAVERVRNRVHVIPQIPRRNFKLSSVSDRTLWLPIRLGPRVGKILRKLGEVGALQCN